MTQLTHLSLTLGGLRMCDIASTAAASATFSRCAEVPPLHANPDGTVNPPVTGPGTLQPALTGMSQLTSICSTTHAADVRTRGVLGDAAGAAATQAEN
jgi:hypothetical protein